MSLRGALEAAFERHAARPALAGGAAGLDYAALRERSGALARGLAREGVAPGERVAALLPNCVELLELYLACALHGAVLVPLNTRLVARELAEVLADAGPRLLVAEAGLAAQVEGTWSGPPPALVGGPPSARAFESLRAPAGAAPDTAAPRADGLAQLYYTSGTTGRAKGVMLTQGNVESHARACVAELALGPADVWGHCAPMFHLADAWACFAVTLAGGRHAFLRRFEAGAALALFERTRVTMTNLVPTMLHRLVEHPRARAADVSSLRLLLSGGAPIAPALVRRVMETFRCEYAQTYGLTETSPFLTLSLPPPGLAPLPPDELLALRARTGRPFAGVEVAVLGADGRPVPRDDRTVGEVHARGPTVTPGYWRRPEETAAAFRDGWLRTGDLARVDAHGYLAIVDRAKDVILTGGETVYSTEVEHVLAEHPDVGEVAVHAVADEEWGERVVAAVVPRAGARADDALAAELVAFCRARLAAFKAPRSVRFLPELPRTGSGKVRKAALRARAEAARGGPRAGDAERP